MLLLIDENVPRSVSDFLRDRGHDVRLVREVFASPAPDPVIAAIGDQWSAIVVTWDRDFEELVRRVPQGKRATFRRLGRLSFKCSEPRGLPLIQRWITSLEFHYNDKRGDPEFRMIAVVQESGLKLM